MQSFRKSIEFFSEEKYRDLDYGTVYYVASRQTPELNEYVKTHADQIAEQINSDGDNWITCKIIYLDEDNPLFPAQKKATFYSAMLPLDDIFIGDNSFLEADLSDDCRPEHLSVAFPKYFATLQKIFDEILNKGEYDTQHLQQEYLIEPATQKRGTFITFDELETEAPADEGLQFPCSTPDEADETPADDYIRFSISSRRESEPVPSHYDKPSRLVITPNNYQVLLPDFSREFRFNAQTKALYVLFLNHEAGIRLADWIDYKNEYAHLYLQFTNRSDTARIRESINRLFDVFSPNVLYVKKSQCNKAVFDAMPQWNMCQYYLIEANYGESHKINLDRSLVTMPDILKSK